MSDETKFFIGLYALIALAFAVCIYIAHLRAECGYYDEPAGACKVQAQEGKP